MISEWQSGHVRPRASTCDTHATQKRRCPHGARATLASRDTRRQTSQTSATRSVACCGCCLFRSFWTRLSGNQPLKLTSGSVSAVYASAFHNQSILAFSSPELISSPAVWCHVFQFRDIQSRVFSSPYPPMLRKRHKIERNYYRLLLQTAIYSLINLPRFISV